MIREFKCIICPNGCDIEAELDGKNIISLQGELCHRGKKYVEQEITDPRRNIATSVIVMGGDIPLVSVRLTNPIPKDKIFNVMEEIRKVKLQAPIVIGQAIIPNVLGLNSDVIATKDVGNI